MSGKCIVMLSLVAIALAACGPTSAGQPYPARPLTLVVGFAPGGGIDINARLLAVKLGQSLGQPVIVENRPGAGSRIANEHVAKSAPDGYTLLVAPAAVAIDMALNPKPGIDAQNELAPVSTIATTPMILVVNSSAPAKDAQELIARAHAMPGRLNYSSAGPGTTLHLYAELFKLRTGTDIVHIPFKGTAPALQALIAGDVDLCFAPVPSVLPFIKAGRLRALATTGTKRSDLLPEIPTMREAGVEGMDASVWYGVFAPAATPPDVINVLARAILDISRTPDYRKRLLELGEEPAATPPEAFRKLLREEMAKWTEVIKVAHIRAD